MKEFLRSMLSTKTSVSFGRAGAFVIVTVNLMLCVYLTITKEIVMDIPLQWAGLATLLFGITKAPDMMPEKKDKPQQQEGGVQ